MSVVLALTGWEAAPWLDALRDAMPGRAVLQPSEVSDPAAVRYVASWRHAPGSLRAYPNLRALFSLGAGVDHVFADPALPDVPVVRMVDPDLTMRMSEWVALHVLLHHRQQALYDWQQSQRIWAEDRHQPAAREVRVGVMGQGVLGADAARKLAVLGFDVAGWSARPRAVDGVVNFTGTEALAAFLARTDILVCLLPLTPETRGILAAPLFAGLARDGRLGGPVLLNAGRGGLQKEADILAALEDGTLRAATLDVFEREPLPAASPLWHHPGVTISPHNAAISHPGSMAAAIAAQVAADEAGLSLRDVVDRARQY